MEVKRIFDVKEILNGKEIMHRRLWLWSLLVSPLITVLFYLFQMSREIPVEYHLAHPITLFAVWITLFLVMGFVVWYCAYKNYGTRLLSFCIWSTALTYFLMIPMYAAIGLFVFELAPTPIIAYIFGLINLYLNIRLRKINRKILQHIIETESQANQRFLDMDNLVVLKAAYKEEMKRWPQVSRYIRKVYKDRKMELATGKRRVDITVLTKKEMGIRRCWLYYLMFLPTTMALFYLVASVGAALLNPQLAYLAVGFVILVIALQFLPAWILYHCAYNKHGTRYLTFILCCTAIAPLAFITNINKEGESTLLVLLIALLFLAPWMYLCVRLRQINKLLQAHQVCNCPEFHQALTLMNHSLSLEELDNAFHHIIEKWPQWERNSSMKYKKKKEEFLSSP